MMSSRLAENRTQMYATAVVTAHLQISNQRLRNAPNQVGVITIKSDSRQTFPKHGERKTAELELIKMVPHRRITLVWLQLFSNNVFNYNIRQVTICGNQFLRTKLIITEATS